jgi:hypothetical protein
VAAIGRVKAKYGTNVLVDHLDLESVLNVQRFLAKLEEFRALRIAILVGTFHDENSFFRDVALLASRGRLCPVSLFN